MLDRVREIMFSLVSICFIITILSLSGSAENYRIFLVFR